MRVLADESQVERMVESLAQAVRRDVGSSGRSWGIIGIRSRGDVLARRLAHKLGVTDVGVLDFTLYRDDLSNAGSQPVVQTTDIPFDVDGMDIVLVDDVLMTGRSIRAALQSLMDLGRPGRVWLAVLVDRGGRELPIAADFHALDLSGRWVQGQAGSTHEMLRAGERVEVKLIPTDDRDAIEVWSADERGEG